MIHLVVFVASPVDVRRERDRLDRVVREINEWARAIGYTLRLERWETDGWPGTGEDKQDVVNRQVGDADITIVLFGKRLGTPTKRASSGTVEEFDRAIRRREEDRSREVFTYFKRAQLDIHDDLEEAQRVKDFRKRIDATNLEWEFWSAADFEQKVRSHLTKALLARASRGQPAEVLRDDAEPDPAAVYVRGLRAREADRPHEEVDWLRRAAEAGYAGAVFDLAVALRTQRKPEEADRWFRVAAARGDARAVYSVGLRLKEQEEPELAEEWIRRAADGGDVAAMYNLGLLLKEKGDGERAELWLRRGAEGGDAQAMYNLGLVLKDKGDTEGAEVWLCRGADGGDFRAMRELGLLLREDPPDEDSEMWLRRAADGGDGVAIQALGRP